MYYLRICQRISNYSQGQRLDWRNDYQQQKLEGDAGWQRQWDNIDKRENKLFDSLCAAFKNQRLFGMVIFIIHYQLLMIVPVYTLYILLNIQNQEYSSTRNKFLVGAVIFIKLFNPFIKLYGQRVLRMVGQAMHDTVSKALITKTFTVSLLSNPNIVSSQLRKIMQMDMQKVIRFPETQAFVIGTLLGLATNILLIVILFGWAGVVSIVVLIANLSIRYYLKDTLQKYGRKVAEATGDRIRQTIDIFNIIKLIKVCALELPYIRKLVKLRQTQLQYNDQRNMFDLIPLFSSMTAFRFVVLAYILTTIWLGNDFRNAEIFTLSYIIVNVNLYLLLNGITNMSEIKISLRNLQDFLQAEEQKNSHIERYQTATKQAITITNGSFYWERLSETETQSQKTRINLSNVQLKVKGGEFVAIIGRYGSGKSSLLHAILGEMKNGGESKVVVNGKVAYTSQKPFIISDTVRNNILFGTPFNEKRYNQAVHFSSLKADLQILAQGDQTLIGERGCTLSGGQKARVAFARAIYADADILILDDVLSAVDAHVGSFIFFETLCKYCKGKTILMVTHALNYLQHTDRIIMMENCQFVANGTFQHLKQHPIFSQIEMVNGKADSKNDIVHKDKADAKQKFIASQIRPVVQEQQALDIFMQRCGGFKFKLATTIFCVITIATLVLILFWINAWGQAPDKTEPKYALVYLLFTILSALGYMILYYFVLKSPILMNMYKDMIRAIMFSPLSYFETTPVAKIVQRISYDLQNLDKVVLLKYFNFGCSVMGCLNTICIVISISLLTSRFVYVIIYVLALILIIIIYSKVLQALKGYRALEEQYKVQINTYFGEIVEGQATIRAYSKVQYKKMEYSQKLAPFNGTRSIINGVISLLTLTPPFYMNAAAIATLLYFFSLGALTKYDGLLLFTVLNEDFLQFVNDSVINFYVNLKIVLKCQEMTKLQPENGYKQIINKWDQETIFEKGAQIRSLSPFTRGQIQFRNVSVCYRKEFGDVLKKVSFKVRPGEKVGIVGRTGSGKSSLFLTLLRIIEPHAGSTFIDGIDCSSMSLSTLRASINFILQDHFLFSGTIRTNVDPVGEHSDEEIIHVLRLCGLWQNIRKKQGLDTIVAQGGENLSVGERQLLNIARALLSKKKIVLVDEATASIDAETDAAIQKLFRIHFAESTVLTIAHRLDSVKNCDRILVLEQGQVNEFDSPSRLLERDSLYRKLCQQMTRQLNK